MRPQLLLALLCAAPLAAQQASFATFGQGCRGTGGPEYAVILPTGSDRIEGNASSTVPFSAPSRFQQVIAAAELGKSAVLDSVSARQEGGLRSPRGDVDIEILLAHTSAGPDSASATFAQNYRSAPATVITRQRYSLPELTGARTPNYPYPRFEFERPFLYSIAQGNLLVEVVTYAAPPSFVYTLDAVDAPGDGVGSVAASSPSALTGVPGSRGLVFFFHGYEAGGAAPAIGGTPPVLGQIHAVFVQKALPHALAVLMTGSELRPGLDLTGIGMPGCTLYTAGEILIADWISTSGSHKWGYDIPNDRSLIGVGLVSQYAVVDPLANAFGVVTSDAGRGTIGL